MTTDTFFSEVRSQPRAIIPASGSPVFVGFTGEEADLRRELGDESFKVFSHVGEQISNVRETFRELYGGPPPGIKLPAVASVIRRPASSLWSACADRAASTLVLSQNRFRPPYRDTRPATDRFSRDHSPGLSSLGAADLPDRA